MLNWSKKVLRAMMEARQKEVERRIARMHLYGMSNRELKDIGMIRGDIDRLV